MTQPLIATPEVYIDEPSLEQTMNASELSEGEAKEYLENLRGCPLLNSRTILKSDSISYRQINYIKDDEQLQEYLPAGLPEEFYNQAYHRVFWKRVNAELQRLSNHAIHAQSYGNAAGKENQAAFMLVHQQILAGAEYVLRGDFQKCFDSVDLNQLNEEDLMPLLGERLYLRQLLLTLQIIPRHLIQTDEWETELKGILQGLSPASRLLDIHLRSFDHFAQSLTPTYVRYVDDFAMCFTTEREAAGAKAQIEQYLDSNYPTMQLHPDKTKIVRWDTLQFVGYGYVQGTKTITLADKSVSDMKFKYNELGDMLRGVWGEAPPLAKCKSRFKELIHAGCRQLHIVQDEAAKTEIWTYISERLHWAFNKRYQGLKALRKAFHELGYKQGQTRKLLCGNGQPVPLAPFSTDKLGELLFNSWYQYQN